jgi:hypothetical protein
VTTYPGPRGDRDLSETEACASCRARGRQLFHKGDGVWRCATCTLTFTNDFDVSIEASGNGNWLLVAVLVGIAVLVVLMVLRGCR